MLWERMIPPLGAAKPTMLDLGNNDFSLDHSKSSQPKVSFRRRQHRCSKNETPKSLMFGGTVTTMTRIVRKLSGRWVRAKANYLVTL
jgi:hypothetical protein